MAFCVFVLYLLIRMVLWNGEIENPNQIISLFCLVWWRALIVSRTIKVRGKHLEDDTFPPRTLRSFSLVNAHVNLFCDIHRTRRKCWAGGLVSLYHHGFEFLGRQKPHGKKDYFLRMMQKPHDKKYRTTSDCAGNKRPAAAKLFLCASQWCKSVEYLSYCGRTSQSNLNLLHPILKSQSSLIPHMKSEWWQRAAASLSSCRSRSWATVGRSPAAWRRWKVWLCVEECTAHRTQDVLHSSHSFHPVQGVLRVNWSNPQTSEASRVPLSSEGSSEESCQPGWIFQRAQGNARLNALRFSIHRLLISVCAFVKRKRQKPADFILNF